jgi:UDP-glucose 4-epimerase
MKVLVTGAGGFLGQRIVAALLLHGHTVRAMVRPAGRPEFPPEVEIYRADLRTASDLMQAFKGVDAIIHAAAAMSLDDFWIFSGTVVATERLLDAMGQSGVKRLVLISSFFCYDTTASHQTLSENSPTAESSMYKRGGYAMAKMWQERLVRRAAQAHGWALTIVRPGFIWGPGRRDQPCIGPKVGKAHVIFGPMRRVALTFVENTADAIVTVLGNARSAGHVYNIVDDDEHTAWHYEGLCVTASDGWRLPLPYHLVKFGVTMMDWLSRMLFRGQGWLPSIFTPVKFDM